jgi:hypothetical protein
MFADRLDYSEMTKFEPLVEVPVQVRPLYMFLLAPERFISGSAQLAAGRPKHGGLPCHVKTASLFLPRPAQTLRARHSQRLKNDITGFRRPDRLGPSQGLSLDSVGGIQVRQRDRKRGEARDRVLGAMDYTCDPTMLSAAGAPASRTS